MLKISANTWGNTAASVEEALLVWCCAEQLAAGGAGCGKQWLMKWDLQDRKRIRPNRADVQRVVHLWKPFFFFFFFRHGHSAAERVDFQMCLQALTYVREGVCMVGADGGWLVSWFKEVQMLISVSAHWAFCRLSVEASSPFFFSFLWFVRLG